MFAITDLVIIFNVPLLRPVLSIITFLLIPGFLFLKILKIDGLGQLKTTLLSLGLSVSILMGIGGLINFLYHLRVFQNPLHSGH